MSECVAAWYIADVPELMRPWLDQCQCEECGSSTLRPSQNDIEDGASVESQDKSFRYACVASGHSGLIALLVIKAPPRWRRDRYRGVQ